jgi:hypothetical protein
MPAIVLLTIDWLFPFWHLVYKYLSILVCSAGKWMDCQDTSPSRCCSVPLLPVLDRSLSEGSTQQKQQRLSQ